jgi:hypothetical protein
LVKVGKVSLSRYSVDYTGVLGAKIITEAGTIAVIIRRAASVGTQPCSGDNDRVPAFALADWLLYAAVT